ncbi:MAG: hypothetical protein HC875_30650, partial [Anaerolineales bacterium]|nr:hypothetical protein [Anaerolineales bacterium]
MVENTEQRPLLTQLWFPPPLWQPGETVMAETMPWALGERWSLVRRRPGRQQLVR